VNLQIPPELAGRSEVRLRAILSSGVASELRLELRSAAPKFHPALLRFADILVIYGTGAGPLTEAGQLALPVNVSLNETPADVLYAGQAPGFVGLAQFNVRIPSALTLASAFRAVFTIGVATGEVQLAPQ
jgi:hypothetical protein